MPRQLTSFLFAALATMLAAPAGAVDGVVLITQDKAEAGNVTPGDARGFPVTISARGSYRLATSLRVRANRDGIVVTATEVSIDLNGFAIDGAGVALTGIVGDQRGLTVRNGTIRAFKADGIYTVGDLLIVEDTRISENGGRGVDANGWARIRNNTFFGNSSNGVVCDSSCHIEGNIVSNNNFNGVVVFSGAVLGNTISSNKGVGIHANGLVGFGNNMIVDNNVSGNSEQVSGSAVPLFPNACSPVAC